MRTLLFYGSAKEHFLPNQVCRILKQEHTFLVHNRNQLTAKGKNLPFQVIECDHLRKIEADHMILFVRKPCDLESIQYIDPAVTVIMNADDHEHVSFAASHRLCSVTYGLSDKDTVTFSSREEGKVVVALQRSVYTIYGKVVDPMEIPCEIRGEYRDFTVLAYVTLLLLLDEIRLTESGSLLIDWTI